MSKIPAKRATATAAEEMPDDLRLRIARLDLAPGDTLVCQAEKPLTTARAHALRNELETCAPQGVRVLLLDPGVTLSVLAKPEAQPAK